MEIAVKKAGEKLKVTVIDKNNKDLEWGKILANMKVPIEGMDKGEERDRWSEIFTLLYHVKSSWRNNTMHPKQTYTEAQAINSHAAVCGFLDVLAALV